MNKENKMAVGALSEAVIHHESITAAIKSITSAVKRNCLLNEPRHVIVTGESGCGKTTLMDLLVKHHYPKQQVKRGLFDGQVPSMLRVTLPANATPKSMARRILVELGEHSNLNQNEAELSERAAKYLKEFNVQLVVFDEFQHLFGLGKGAFDGASARLLAARNWVKSMVNASMPTTFVLMGIPELLPLVHGDPQLERRFTVKASLPRFNCPEKDKSEFARFFDSLLNTAAELLGRKDLALRIRHDLPAARRLFLATGGVPSAIKELVTDALISALEQGQNHIALGDLGVALKLDREPVLDAKREQAVRRQRFSIMQRLVMNVVNPLSADMDYVDQCLHELTVH